MTTLHETESMFLRLSPTLQAAAIERACLLTRVEDVETFGLDVQQHIQQLSTQLFQHVKQHDSTKITTILQQLLRTIENIELADFTPKQSLFARFLKKQRSLQETMSHVNKQSKQVDRLAIQLQHAEQYLLREQQQLIALLTKQAQIAQKLHLYIAAIEWKENTLQQVENHSKTPADTIEQTLLSSELTEDSFARRKYDLLISYEIAMQQTVQIQRITETNNLLIDKIHAATNQTIPLWQTQLAMLSNQGRQKQAIQLQQRLQQQAERSIVDNDEKFQSFASHDPQIALSQLQQTQQQLLHQLQDSMKIEQQLQQAIEQNSLKK